MPEQRVVTSVTYVSDGTTPNFAVPFEYLSQDHVKVYINAVPLENYRWNSQYSVNVISTPNVGDAIMVQRETPFDEQMITWHDGSVIFSDDMNMADLQLLFILQEIKDPYNLNVKDLDEYLDALKQSLPCPFGRFSITEQGNLILDVFGTLPPDQLYIDQSGHLILDTDNS